MPPKNGYFCFPFIYGIIIYFFYLDQSVIFLNNSKNIWFAPIPKNNTINSCLDHAIIGIKHKKNTIKTQVDIQYVHPPNGFDQYSSVDDRFCILSKRLPYHPKILPSIIQNSRNILKDAVKGASIAMSNK